MWCASFLPMPPAAKSVLASSLIFIRLSPLRSRIISAAPAIFKPYDSPPIRAALEISLALPGLYRRGPIPFAIMEFNRTPFASALPAGN